MTMHTEDGSFSTEQMQALLACVVSTAHVDGIKPQELELLDRFCGDNQYQASLKDLLGKAGDKSHAKAMLAAVGGDATFVEQVLLMSIMTAYADGRISDAELAHVNELAESVGVPASKMAELRLYVRDSLLGSLSHLPDAESVAALAKSM
jgi:tellurite resistance protein